MGKHKNARLAKEAAAKKAAAAAAKPKAPEQESSEGSRDMSGRQPRS